jgi:NADH:ubiquinone reductase (H+-translocating)
MLQFARKDDSPVNFRIGGRVGASLKEAICKGTVWGLRRGARKPEWAIWFKGGPRPEQPAFAEKVVTET